MTQPIYVFDGVCVFCSRAVRYLLRHERDHTIRIVAIQSGEGRALAMAQGIDPDEPVSFLFVENGVPLQKSDAVLALLAHVGGPAQMLRVMALLPRPLRDWLYEIFARNRYALFGKRTSCFMPDPVHRHRFVLPEA
jgi:predicted DCC family thiol-disulfide oxidoreductase YuxK